MHRAHVCTAYWYRAHARAPCHVCTMPMPMYLHAGLAPCILCARDVHVRVCVCSVCVFNALPCICPRRDGDDFLARLAQVERLSTEAQPRGSAPSKADDMKSEKAAAPLDNIKSAMDGAGEFIANFFLGMGGASGAKEKELAKKTAPREGPEVDSRLYYALVHMRTVT